MKRICFTITAGLLAVVLASCSKPNSTAEAPPNQQPATKTSSRNPAAAPAEVPNTASANAETQPTSAIQDKSASNVQAPAKSHPARQEEPNIAKAANADSKPTPPKPKALTTETSVQDGTAKQDKAVAARASMQVSTAKQDKTAKGVTGTAVPKQKMPTKPNPTTSKKTNAVVPDRVTLAKVPVSNARTTALQKRKKPADKKPNVKEVDVESPTLRLVHSCNLQGELEPCG